MNKFVIQKESKNERLDKFLVKKFPQYSRSYLQKNIKEGKIQVLDKIVKPNHKLEAGDIVKARIEPPEKISLDPDPSISFDIVYEDEDLMVINKPSGLIVHAGVKNPKNTLVNALLAHCPGIKGVGDDPALRPGIVHRLDKDVSGLMVIAKNNTTFQHLKKQFKQRKVKKIYTALAWGKFKQRKDKIDLPIAQNPKNPAKMVVVRDLKNKLASKSQTAFTKFEVLKQFDNLALIRVYLKTGRRHQIRVHFKSIGHSLVNDRLYNERRQAALGPGRIFLHATQLEFFHPSGKTMQFNSPLPKELGKILNSL